MIKYFLKKYFNESGKFLKVSVDKAEYIDVRFDRFLSNKFNIHWNSLQKHFRKNEIFLIRGSNNSKEEKVKIKDQNEKLKLEDEIFIINRIIEKKKSDENQNFEQNKSTSKIDNKNFHFDESEKENLMKIFEKMIVLKSDQLIIIDKITNLACQGGTSLKFSIDTMIDLLNEKKLFDMKLIHRLDKNVGGLMMLGNRIETTRIMGEFIKNNKIEKSYLAVTQNIPLYIKHLLKEKKINVNVTKTLNSFFSGCIKSDENCDKFLLELDSGYQFLFDETFQIIKPKAKMNFDKIDELNMIGRFKITNLFYFNREEKKFKVFKLDAVENYSYEMLNDFNNFFSRISDNFEKNENRDQASNVECYSVINYELVSGKKHQIRKHLTKCFFTPIFNDEEYMFDKEYSSELYSKFSQIENKVTDVSNPLYDKFKLNSMEKSILLQSISIDMPKFELTNLSHSNKINVAEKNTKLKIRFNEMPSKFRKLFDLANVKVSLY